MAIGPTTSFTLYRCVNLETRCDSSFFAVNEDRTVLVMFGENSVDLVWRLPRELPDWLAHDFVPTGQVFACDVVTVQLLIGATFADKGDLVFIKCNEQLEPTTIEFSLASQKTAEGGADFAVQGRGTYRRFNREPQWERAVTLTERALLDVCCAVAAELTQEFGAEVREPSPITTRNAAASQPSH